MRIKGTLNWRSSSVLVTGGTGSIGSEIARQLLQLNPRVLRLFSRDETKHYMLGEELGHPKNVRFLVGDVRDRARLKRAMEGVDVVFHAAALKHVPSCEYNPFEAVQTNVVGTQNVIEAAMDACVKKVVLVSTDKAVNPLHTMGTTKLLAEKIVIAADAWSKNTRLCAVRFGNVLGSRGSVVPLCKEQIRSHRPVVLTDADMTRFVMTIPDAARLVIRAAELSSGGEIFILKMPALKVKDLIGVLVEEWGKGKKVAIKRTGARLGEKLHEELMTREESQKVKDLKGDGIFVIYPEYKIERQHIRLDKVSERLFVSSVAEHLMKSAIRNLLLRGHLLP